ncbi:cytochrome P450 [Sphingomonas sp. IC-11]|uniref:cytochrome P450 n=1 Tax=Sphingomonas sp. IC-11 TaxID=2898528 RepID=UPI001E2F059A|nr:cytochrome P450 [Sphingomonas sp. IC-11]MCD2316048.1 cytochrome P450 [Sphingomonas sp. IC-11]
MSLPNIGGEHVDGLFVPPFPDPHPKKSSLFWRFVRGWNSWIHVLFEKSYTMKMGEIRTPGLHMYIANELPLVKRIMNDWRGFPKHHLLVRTLGPAIGNSVFSANGDDWATQREMINPAFQQAALGRTLPMMRDAADALVERVRRSDLDRPIDVDPLMTHVAADVIFRTLFSSPLSEGDARRIHDAFNRFQRHAQSASMLRFYRMPTLGFFHRSRRAAADIHGVFAHIVQRRLDAYRATGDLGPSDILASLMEARHPKTGAPFSFTDLMGQVSTIFLAGHETSASALSWALYCLAEEAESQRIARDEVLFVAGTRPIQAEMIRRMPIIRNVFRETLRLYPPVAFMPREVSCPTQMRDKQLAPGAMVVVSPWLIQRNPEHWRCPHAFHPARFDDPDAKTKSREAWLPFGAGPRICVGAGFATQEAAVVLATLLRTFTIRAVPGEIPEPVSRLTLRPKRGVKLYFSLR